jgi:hypothetical protein
MEKMMDLLLNAENVRMALMMMFGYCGYVLLKTSFEKRIDGAEKRLDGKIDSAEKRLDGKIDGLDKKIDGVEASLLKAMDEKINAFHEHLKTNDFAHLNSTIEALTFMLEKNGFLEKEDKDFIDKRLDK